MNQFTYSYPTKVYFGEGAAKQALPQELGQIRQDRHAGLRRRLGEEERHL